MSNTTTINRSGVHSAPAPETPSTRWTPTAPLLPGPEMEALKRFHFDCKWIGTVEPNGMGPGSPLMQAEGRGIFTPLMDGLWLAGDFEQQQFVNCETIITWKAHYVVGWDPRAREYKVTFVDNNGGAALMVGRIEGNRFIVETFGNTQIKLRLVWEIAGEKEIKWSNWMSLYGGQWTLVEEYMCVPL